MLSATRRRFRVEDLEVAIFEDAHSMGDAAAAHAARLLGVPGPRRVMIGTGPSQLALISALVRHGGVDWSSIEIFHLDEYAGLPETHSASFRRWLNEHVVRRVQPARVHYVEGDAADMEAECLRYAGLLSAAPIDIAFVGFGENGHIAFNDPHEADFEDRRLVKLVTLDEACRRQQVGEGHFRDIASVPARAITVTCPAIMAARAVVAFVPDRRKAQAVKCAILGPVTTACPASILRRHTNAVLFLDQDSASLLN